MLLLAIAGLWAMWHQSITITESLSLEGRPARFYGISLLGAAAMLYLLSPLLAHLQPEVLVKNPAASLAVDALIMAVIVIGLVLPFRRKERA